MCSQTLHEAKKCGAWASLGECSGGHIFAKELLCGREWCPVCGQRMKDGGKAHARRFARWVPKAEQIASMGYLVVTFPLDARQKLRSKEALSRVRRAIIRGLKARGYSRGLARWHWFGDPKVPVVVPALWSAWHPHLNFLFDGGYMVPEDLEELRRFLAGVAGVSHLVAHYQFSSDVAQKVGWLEYVTRPTFRDREWDPAMAEELYGYRNCNPWGKWDGPLVWHMDGESRLGQLERGECPECGGRIRWRGVVRTNALWALGLVRGPGGYWVRGADSELQRGLDAV